MFCQQLSKAIIKETQNTLIQAMAGWLNKPETWGTGHTGLVGRATVSGVGAGGGKGAAAEDAEGGGWGC